MIMTRAPGHSINTNESMHKVAMSKQFPKGRRYSPETTTDCLASLTCTRVESVDPELVKVAQVTPLSHDKEILAVLVVDGGVFS